MKKEPLESKNPQPGKIKLIKYRSRNLVVPLVENLVRNRPTGSICVLTCTNDQALLVSSLLNSHGVLSRLIQSNDRFDLLNLLEIRDFINEIEDTGSEFVIFPKVWEKAKATVWQRYAGSDNLHFLQRLIEDFANINPTRKFKSDLIAFIRESRLEDFLSIDQETILVSTIHKAKGKEFDNVCLLLDNFDLTTAETKRQVYVAVTRAKTGLTIHHNSDQFAKILGNKFTSEHDTAKHQPPNELVLELGYKDVYLDRFFEYQEPIASLSSGDELKVTDKGCCTTAGEICLAFSKTGIKRLEKMREKGYQPVKATVNFIIYWKKANKANEPEKPEIRIILPILQFRRSYN